MRKIRHSILTLQGKQELFKALNSKDKAIWNKVVVGSGDIDSVEHKELMTELVNQEWEGDIQDFRIEGNVVILKIILDSSVGGFEITELGIKNSVGELVVVASSDIGYKNKLGENNGFDEIELDLRVKVDDTALVEIVCDESNIYVTREELNSYVKNEVVKEVDKNLDEAIDEKLQSVTDDIETINNELNSLSEKLQTITSRINDIDTKLKDIDLSQIKINKDNITTINNTLNGVAEFLERYI